MAIKRMNYFKGEFLQENDFREEQQYHIDMLRKHNKNLHSWGIINGIANDLNVTKISGNSVQISSGMAINSLGQQIVLLANSEKIIPDTTKTTLYLTISHDEKPSDSREDAGIRGDTRITEEPKIEFLEDYPVEPSMQLVLAKLTLSNKTITEINKDDRKSATATIAPGSIDTPELADNSVSTDKIASGAITTDKIAGLSVGTTELADNAVISAKLQSHETDDDERAVTTNHIKDNAVTTAKITDYNITNIKIAPGAITTDKIAGLSVGTTELAENAVISTKLQSHATVDSNRSVSTNHIRDRAVTAAKLDIEIQNDINYLKDFAANIDIFTNQKDAINAILKGNLPSDNEIKLVDFSGYYGGGYIFSYKDNNDSTWFFWNTSENGGGNNFWCKRYSAGSWGGDTQLTTGKTNKSFNKVLEDKAGNIWLFWYSYESGGGYNIWCKRYSDGSWGADIQLSTGTTSKSYINSFDDKAGNFWVFWNTSESGGGKYWNNFWCRRYTYSTYSWGEETQLTTGTTSKYYSNSFSENAGNTWLFWYSPESDGGYNIWWKKYSAGSWGADTQLTSGTTSKGHLNSGDKAGSTWVFWTNPESGGGNNFWCNKYSAGSWGTDTQLTTGTTSKGYIKVLEDSAGNIWLFWYSYASGGGYNIWCKKYSGGSWGAETQLTTGTTNKSHLNSFDDGAGNIWLFWNDSGNLWCKKYSAASWGTDTQLTSGTTSKGHLNSFGDKAGSTWVFWNAPESGGGYNFWCKKYSGGSWGADTQLTPGTTSKGYIKVLEDSAGDIWLFWISYETAGGYNFWCKKYSAGSWGAETQLTTGTTNKSHLNSFDDGAGNIWLFWYSYASGGGYNIWCKKYGAGSWGADEQMIISTASKSYLNSFEDGADNIWLFWNDSGNLWCRMYSDGNLGDDTQLTSGTTSKGHLNSFGDKADNTWVFWNAPESGGGYNFWCKKYSGGSWGAETQLTTGTTSKGYIKVLEDSAGNIWLFWISYETAGGYNIWCKKYSGGSWGAETQLTTGTTSKGYMKVFEDSAGDIWLFWYAYESASGYKYWCKKYSAGSWGADTQLTTGTTSYGYLNSFEDNAGNIWLLWYAYESAGGYNFWCKKYSAGSWGADTQLTTGKTYKSYIKVLEDSAGNIWLLWYSYHSGGGYNIWCKKYSAGSWAGDTQLSTAISSYINSFEDKAGNIWLFWYTYESAGGYKCWCKKYSAGGWGAAIQLTDTGFAYIKSFGDREGNIWFLYTMPDNIWCKRYSGDDWLPEMRLTSGTTSKNHLNSFEDDKGNMWLFWSRYLPTSASFWCKKLYSSV